ncbi:MAG: hypothetical protein AB1714_11210 [Acidobacteriota bacterium]
MEFAGKKRLPAPPDYLRISVEENVVSFGDPPHDGFILRVHVWLDLNKLSVGQIKHESTRITPWRNLVRQFHRENFSEFWKWLLREYSRGTCEWKRKADGTFELVRQPSLRGLAATLRTMAEDDPTILQELHVENRGQIDYRLLRQRLRKRGIVK